MAAYGILYSKVVDPNNKYPQLSIKTVEQVYTEFVENYRNFRKAYIGIYGPSFWDIISNLGPFNNKSSRSWCLVRVQIYLLYVSDPRIVEGMDMRM